MIFKFTTLSYDDLWKLRDILECNDVHEFSDFIVGTEREIATSYKSGPWFNTYEATLSSRYGANCRVITLVHPLNSWSFVLLDDIELKGSVVRYGEPLHDCRDNDYEYFLNVMKIAHEHHVVNAFRGNRMTPYVDTVKKLRT